MIYFIGNILYVLWISLFLNRRRVLDYKQFQQSSKEHNKVIELLNGMQEIKLHNAETEKRWEWEYLQAELFKIDIQKLFLEQIEAVGPGILNEAQNILVGILSATLVINGQLTIGMMMAVAYIMGQLNGPVEQLINFIYTVQDTSIALERLSEIHNKPDEQIESNQLITHFSSASYDLVLKNLSFRYNGKSNFILKKVNLTIPANKLTAIVGTSGSGKTTLMKLMLKFYQVHEGSICIGNVNLNKIAHHTWRNYCGVVMQEGFLFNDTIARNIAIDSDKIDENRLIYATEIANIKEFIDELPLGYNTRVGMDGVGISTGEKQRILIARAVYKNPQCIFFDEATSALDATNEHYIMASLEKFFKGRTAVVIAHRMSTVRNADQIVVLGKSSILEQGTHQELLRLQGHYYQLVKNQLAV